MSDTSDTEEVDNAVEKKRSKKKKDNRKNDDVLEKLTDTSSEPTTVESCWTCGSFKVKGGTVTLPIETSGWWRKDYNLEVS